MASLAAGNGARSDLDALRQDPVTEKLLGIETVPSGRRLVEYLARMGRHTSTLSRASLAIWQGTWR